MHTAVICDWDGTLADTRQVVVLSFQKALSETNLKTTDEYIARRMGIGAAETFREIIRSNGKQVEEDLVMQLVERKSQLEVELTPMVKLFPGARELLEALQGKVKLGLASMNNRVVIEHMVKYFELDACFLYVLTGDQVSHSKPNPEIFLKTAQALKTIPYQCVVLEDSVFGVQAAKAGGMGCVAVTTGVYSEEELSQKRPDLIVGSLADKQVLRFILG
jgi:beta-phosphoglucomutase